MHCGSSHSGSGRSRSSDLAPRWSASPTNSLPCRVVPGTAANRQPADTSAEEQTASRTFKSAQPMKLAVGKSCLRLTEISGRMQARGVGAGTSLRTRRRLPKSSETSEVCGYPESGILSIDGIGSRGVGDSRAGRGARRTLQTGKIDEPHVRPTVWGSGRKEPLHDFVPHDFVLLLLFGIDRKRFTKS